MTNADHLHGAKEEFYFWSCTGLSYSPSSFVENSRTHSPGLQALSVVCGSCQGGATLPLTSGRSREPRSWILTLVPVPNKFNKAVFSFYLKLFVVSVHSCPAPWFGSTTDSLHCLFSLCIDASLPSNLSSSGSSTSFCSVNRKCVLPKWAALF